MTTRFSVLALLIISTVGVQASPVFEFIWTTPYLPTVGSPAGVTFTGEIFGLPDNGSGPASEVVLDSITGATLDPGIVFDNLPLDLLGPDFEPMSPTSFFTANEFVVQNDVITSAEFAVQAIPNLGPEDFILGQGSLFLDFLSGGILDSAPPDVVFTQATPVAPDGYYGTATYTLVTPEPSTFGLMLLALGALCGGAVVISRRGFLTR